MNHLHYRQRGLSGPQADTVSVAGAMAGVLVGSVWAVWTRRNIESRTVRAIASLGLVVGGRMVGVPPSSSFRSGLEGVVALTALVDVLVPDRPFV
jgi:hypothetical protein